MVKRESRRKCERFQPGMSVENDKPKLTVLMNKLVAISELERQGETYVE